MPHFGRYQGIKVSHLPKRPPTTSRGGDNGEGVIMNRPGRPDILVKIRGKSDIFVDTSFQTLTANYNGAFSASHLLIGDREYAL